MNINATLIIQIVVFIILWWFTARFVWPPITKALDERSRRISDGLAAADRAKADLAAYGEALGVNKDWLEGQLGKVDNV
ncbi:MAG: hypothetical protein EBX63_11305, partial [Betaproteobacteria bacterium]|nr:hypothetical protein [Betaproteobacteria bacterium]